MNPRRPSILVVLVAIVASTLGCAKWEEIQSNDNAKRRVKGLLDGVQKGGASSSGETQRAICLWYRGKLFIPEIDTLSRASDLFLVWQKQGGIARNISGFTVTGAERIGNRTVLVSGTIEDKPFTMKVVEEEPISWVKPPQ